MVLVSYLDPPATRKALLFMHRFPIVVVEGGMMRDILFGHLSDVTPPNSYVEVLIPNYLNFLLKQGNLLTFKIVIMGTS